LKSLVAAGVLDAHVDPVIEAAPRLIAREGPELVLAGLPAEGQSHFLVGR
jgi:hypothetical protein